MKLLLDNNLPPALAQALNALSEAEWDGAHSVTHLKKKFAANTPDTTWITALAAEGDWVVITHDKLDKGAEREALKRAGLKVFLLDKSWGDHRFWEKAVNLARWWPRIIEQAEGLRGGAKLRVRWKFSGKGLFEQMQ